MPELSRRVLCAALLVTALAALFLSPPFRSLLNPQATMNPDSELEFQMPGVIRAYTSGRVERFDGTKTVPPSPAGDPDANGVASKDVALDPAANISARVYLPPGLEPGKKLPVRRRPRRRGPAVVVSVNYRLAPEHRLPAAYDDAFAALKAVVAACHRAEPDGAEEAEGELSWLAAHGDASRVVLAGDSAGGNMAHNAAIRLRKEGGVEGLGDAVSGVALLHPYFWGKEPLGAEPTDAGYRSMFDPTWDFICGGKFDLDHPYVNPLASPEEWRQMGSRRVLVTTAEQCWFVERARAYAEGVKKCGWEGELQFYETKGEAHVFFLPKHGTDKAVKELAIVADFVRRC
ncbi:hypothetical protein PR202_ga15608 [Eleusine coracana subsp. coracana]|uniref:Alpha/beta hydrolase fold-3 domain-containing protein n=1 Tax=Eleusine coracana subsp. coracana TaxID=191504 RepID=A0AAV5CJW2_ELECO|nr:hypothetical protein PR202_ga15608 [Eleusine coracana subsp. coracana]